MSRRSCPILLIWVLLLCAVHVAVARRLIRCQIARELYANGIPRNQINDWVCLVMSESSGDTEVIGGPNIDGSHDHGLFQINDMYWCGAYGRGKGCNVACSDLRTDDISAAVRCAKHVYEHATNHRGERQHFNAWEGWKKECKNRRLTDYTKCLNKDTCSCGSSY